MKVKVKKLSPTAKLPVYSTEGAGCFDLYADKVCSSPDVTATVLYDASSLVIYTGLAFEVPKDHVMLVFSRSGHGMKENIRLANCVGVIDSDYRGELIVKLTKDTDRNLGSNEARTLIKAQERIAQAMIIPVQQVEFELADELSDTYRGVNGFGSTGVN